MGPPRPGLGSSCVRVLGVWARGTQPLAHGTQPFGPRDAAFGPRDAAFGPRDAAFGPRDAAFGPRDAAIWAHGTQPFGPTGRSRLGPRDAAIWAHGTQPFGPTGRSRLGPRDAAIWARSLSSLRKGIGPLVCGAEAFIYRLLMSSFVIHIIPSSSFVVVADRRAGLQQALSESRPERENERGREGVPSAGRAPASSSASFRSARGPTRT